MHRGRDHDRGDDGDDDWTDDPWEVDDDAYEEPTVRCPACRQEMLEDSPRCPACGHYPSTADDVGTGKPAWVIVTALICLGMALWWICTAA
ncbi:MAG: hypothetical protein ACK6CT_13705 [Planctomycetia bacterium]|jgi:uncharacterized protein (DUF983 family)